MIFLGEVAATIDIEHPELRDRLWPHKAIFRVERVWKGLPTEWMRVSNNKAGTLYCSWPFEKGWRGVVFASRAEDGSLRTGYCHMLPYHGHPDIRADYDRLLPGHETAEERQARIEAQRAAKIDEKISRRLRQAKDLLRANEPARAAAILERALTLDPEHAELRALLGQARGAITK